MSSERRRFRTPDCRARAVRVPAGRLETADAEEKICRGPVGVTKYDLHDALVGGEIGVAGLDVMPEQPPEREALFDLDGVVATPHVAWYSEASIATLRRTAARQVRTVLEGGVLEHLANDELAE